MQKSEINEKIIRNFYRIKVAPRSTEVREWEKFEPAEIYNLLKHASPTVKPEANELIFKLVATKWTLMATAHDKGSTNPLDRLHITLRVGSAKAHHLYCREVSGGGLQVIKITQR